MRITKFNEAVAAVEGGKVGVSIAQIAEVNRATNELTGGKLYAEIKKLDRIEVNKIAVGIAKKKQS